jgi:sugar lactone lactonase YvrE
MKRCSFGLPLQRFALLAIVAGSVLAGAVTAGAAHQAGGGRITTIAGTGQVGVTGDGGPAEAAEINHPRGLARLPDGSILFTDAFGADIRRISPDGTISTFAGEKIAGIGGDGGPATRAYISLPHGITVLPDHSVLFADAANQRIRLIDPHGIIHTVAGTSSHVFNGDDIPAVDANVEDPHGVSATSDGGYLIADTTHNRVRRVSPEGHITTVAGTGVAGFSGDGGPATAAMLHSPFDVKATPDGGFLIADIDNQRIRKVSASGIITTVAGTGVAGFSGDGGPATSAQLSAPHSVALSAKGGFYIADASNNRVRYVDPSGRITTVAGNGRAGFSGDGGPATAATLQAPKAMLELPDGGLVIADSTNHRVRYVGTDSQPYFVRLKATLAPIAARSGRPLALNLELTTWASVQVNVREGAQRVGTQSVPISKPGPVKLRVNAALVAGHRYTVVVTTKTIDGQLVQVTRRVTAR